MQNQQYKNCGLINIPRDYIIVLGLLIGVSLPNRIVALFFVLLGIGYLLVKHKIKLTNLIIILSILCINFFWTIFLNGPKFFINFFLFVLFFSPVLTFILLGKIRKNLYLKRNINKAIEHYIIIQLFINILNIYYLVKRDSFDLGAGDIIAGTFRFPMTVKPDSNNMLFSLSMILLLFVYLNFNKDFKKLIVIFLILTIFFASVNHLIIITLISLAISYLFTSSFFIWIPIFGLLGFVIFLYKWFQPANFYNITSKFDIIIVIIIKNFKYLKYISLKFQYIGTLFSDFFKYPYMIFFGTGLGTYSSRAALYLTGHYVHSHIFNNISNNISKFMLGNTYPLFLSLKKFSLGSFNYPWGSLFSLLAEVGIPFSVILVVLFIKELKKIILQKRNRIFILIFFALIGLIENYYEYFQATFIFFFILLCYHNSVDII